MILSKDQLNRYLRNIKIPEIGEIGQNKLLNSKVLIYASTVEEATSLIYYLAASGVGFISCHLKNNLGFDNLLSKVHDLNGDVVLEITDCETEGFLIKILITNYENLKDSLINLISPTILAVNSNWRGLLKVINNKEDFEYIFSNSLPSEISNNEGTLLSSYFLGTLAAIECIKICLNIGTSLNNPLYFDLLSMEFSKLQYKNIKSSIFDLLKESSSYNSLPSDITKTIACKILSESKVLVVGTGGLGSPVIYALSTLGIGTIGIVDYDVVEISNLNRQILHSTSKIGMPKVDSAKIFIHSLAPKVNIITYNTPLNATNALHIVNDYDVVVDAVDNFPSRYLLNDSCFFANKPLVDAAVAKFHGLIMTILPQKGPCYRCTFPSIENKIGSINHSEAGILGAVPGVMGFLQAAEVVKLLLCKENTLYNRIIYYDALDSDFDSINTEKSVNCALCGSNPTITSIS